MKLMLIHALLGLLLLVACAGGHGTDQLPAGSMPAAGILPFDDSSLTGVEVLRSGSTLEISIDRVDGTGKFFKVPLSGGRTILSETWNNDQNLLHLSVIHGAELHVGVCALADNQAASVQVRLELGEAVLRHSAEVPDGENNQLVDLQADSRGDGTVELSWSEVNRGDYDFNGETNISDITGLARSLHLSYDTFDPQATQLTEYWADGNQDGEVSISDLTIIGQNYFNRVAGYAVNRNGEQLDPDSSGFTILRGDSQTRPGLPNFYGTQFTGSVTDTITVIPRDTDGNTGIASDPPPPVPQFSVSVNINMGLDNTGFYDLDGSGLSGAFGDGRYAVTMFDLIEMEPLRRILPGEIPSSVEIGTALPSGLHAQLYDLPTDRPLALGLLYLPTRDLATELEIDPPDGSPIDSVWDLEPQLNVYPLPLQAGPQTQDLSVNLSISKVGGIKVIGISTFSGVDGPLGQPLVQEFDDQFLSRNTEDDGFDFPASFEDDVRMADGHPDQQTWGVTQNLLQRLMLEAILPPGERKQLTMTAQIIVGDSINTAQGFVKVHIQSMSIDGVPVPELELPVEPVFLKFTELSEFEIQINGGIDSKHISPAGLLVEDTIDISGELQLAAGEAGVDLYWIDNMLVHLR